MESWKQILVISYYEQAIEASFAATIYWTLLPITKPIWAYYFYAVKINDPISNGTELATGMECSVRRDKKNTKYRESADMTK